ncbi:MarR family winged helix-turn-helix transcriptional regulator [Bosea sp. BH3]|uniref:MarR family winged helix-turn-helix transcriptional regulator n=1 Tax=Bosea sp. BH3 TaxID=2871701 RepID=UPI0021CB4B5E|nr:MarR family transcriptional regulator [Bosea sp. BH3]MCU4179300.1 MarR family transcriptional regulator [Bosea sp. BH3]
MKTKSKAQVPVGCVAPEDVPDAFFQLACTNTALRRATRRLGQLYDDAIGPLGLKATQFGLLVAIHGLTDEGKGPTLNDVAARQLVQISALTHALRPLVRDGLVALNPDPEDRRSKRATLTPAGRERMQQAVSRWAQANGRVETTLGPGVAGGLRALADLIASERFLDAYRSGRPLEGS